MQSELPVVVCVFGWGQTFQIYADYLSVNGKSYPLIDLTYLCPTYRSVMGIPSARLELHFGREKLLFRGIAAIADVQKVIDYLSPWCGGFNLPKPSTDWAPGKRIAQPISASQPTLQEYEPTTSKNPSIQDIARSPVLPVETTDWQPSRPKTQVDEQKKQRGDRFHFSRYFKGDSLPIVPVPVRLLHDEQAHYSTSATLCGERISESFRYTYPAQDQGTLILTSKRMIYIGRKSQIVLDYARLLHVSRLRDAIAFEAEHWQKRVIFELRQPLECSTYLECILERFRQEEKALSEALGTPLAGYEASFDVGERMG